MMTNKSDNKKHEDGDVKQRIMTPHVGGDGGDGSLSTLLLPSELYSKYIVVSGDSKKGMEDKDTNISSKEDEDDNNGSSDIDAESMIQNMLSCLASLQQQKQQGTRGGGSGATDDDTNNHKKKKAIPNKKDIPKWIWKGLTTMKEDDDDDFSGSITRQKQKTNLSSTTKNNDEYYYHEWWMGIRYIQHFSSQLLVSSPFELHSIAKESILFGDSEEEKYSSSSLLYSTLCLLICVYALRQCPCPITKRYKRWQSLVCETIRLYQIYGMMHSQQEEFANDSDSNSNNLVSLSLWMDYVVPATLHVIQNLPTPSNEDDDDDDCRVNRLPLLSALIGTTTHLAKRECENMPTGTTTRKQSIINTTTIEDNIQELLEDLRTILNQFGYSEIWVWINPWRKTTNNRFVKEATQRRDIKNSIDDDDGDDEHDIDYIQNKDKIEWWNGYVDQHDSVAGMDTSWEDELGISLLATLSFVDRPLVLSSNFTWKVWFPHVPTLLRSVTTGTIDGGTAIQYLEPLPLYLLDQLTKCTPEHSLPSVGSYSKKVHAPFETFKLLSDRILSLQAASIDSSPSSEGGGEQSGVLKARSEHLVGLMKNLLTRYQPINQIKIVRKLVHDCPHPGLKAKCIDLLRPILFNEEALDAFWSYIRSFVKDMLDHHDEKQRILLDVDELVDKVEIYVGIITMIQLWMMVNKGRLPPKVSSKPLGRFYKTLNKKLKNWLLDDSINNDDDDYHHDEEEENQVSSTSQEVAARVEAAPDNYYRLYLLEGALQQVLEKKQSNNGSGDDEDGSQSTTPASAAQMSSAADHTSPGTKKRATGPIVGDADIFL